MWVFLSDAMLSIVEHRGDASLMIVRARIPGDIERVFPDVEVSETPNADYRFRASIGREKVATALSSAIENIDYDNFKIRSQTTHAMTPILTCGRRCIDSKAQRADPSRDVSVRNSGSVSLTVSARADT